jgi:hypothetical protein
MPRLIHKSILVILLSVICYSISAQRAPQLIVKGVDKSAVRLDKLKIYVFVIDNIATTTIEMSFYNSTSRVLEGQLNFPLNEGATVSRFALDVNGEMREGVVVEKEKATQVFEAVTRKQIDPGIIEKTVGNNFRARVYPIPAKGYKKAIIAFEHELKTEGDNFIYNLPLDYKNVLSEFTIDVEVVNNIVRLPNNRSNLINLNFKNKRESYISKYSDTNVKLQKLLSFVVEKPKQSGTIFTCRGSVENADYFYINTTPEKESRPKIKPDDITIIWDASSSASKRDIDKELSFIGSYLNWVKNCNITVIRFSNVIDSEKRFRISNGKSKEIIQYLADTRYDGGTQLGTLNMSEIKADEILLFTDAISNFGKHKADIDNASPVITVNSSSVANISYLKYISETTNGRFINLNETTNIDALTEITTQSKQFISAESPDNNLYDIYPNRSSQVSNNFSVAGKIRGKRGIIKLNFGYGGKVTETVTYIIDNKEPLHKDLAERMWVQKKIAELNIFEQDNNDEITKIGKRFSVVTKNTSLIVLDNIQDYIRYEITPPESMKQKYNIMLKRKRADKQRSTDRRLDYISNRFKKDIRWWDNAIDSRGIKHSKDNSGNNQDINNIRVPRNHRLVKGTVLSREDGLGIPGANVIIEGTRRGVATNIDGEFAIAVPENRYVLEFSTMGFAKKYINIRDTETVRVILDPENIDLDEVVVVGYGTSSITTTGATSNVSAEEVLSKTVAGVQVAKSQSNSTQPPIVNTNLQIADNDIEIEEEFTDQSENDKRVARKSSIKINAWQVDAKYISELDRCSDSEMYNCYLKLKEQYTNTPSFYFDVAGYMFKKGKKNIAVKILSNITELNIENHEIMRSLGRKLSEFGEHKRAIEVYNDVLKIRSFEPQSYRDLGIAYADNNEPQKAIETLYKIIDKDWDSETSSRFRDIEIIILHEINNIISQTNKRLDTEFIDKRFIKNMPVDIRIVIDWDANDTDIDLWVTDPLFERCSYKNKETKIGAKISNDITTGYGPEEFMLKHAIKGDYYIEVDFYGSSKQSVTGPVTVKAFIYTNFGRKNQTKEVLTIQITEKGKKTYSVGEITFKK